eukprot:2290810-Rhodomonas_salina.1
MPCPFRHGRGKCESCAASVLCPGLTSCAVVPGVHQAVCSRTRGAAGCNCAQRGQWLAPAQRGQGESGSEMAQDVFRVRVSTWNVCRVSLVTLLSSS